MNLLFVQKLINNWWISPAWWRLIEVWILSWIVYLLSSLMTWDTFSIQALMIAILTPVSVYINKQYRDYLDKIKEIENENINEK